ncbi:MAG: hypothetical protein AAB426_10740 [Myxococcota bacterium]
MSDMMSVGAVRNVGDPRGAAVAHLQGDYNDMRGESGYYRILLDMRSDGKGAYNVEVAMFGPRGVSRALFPTQLGRKDVIRGDGYSTNGESLNIVYPSGTESAWLFLRAAGGSRVFDMEIKLHELP